MNKEKQSQTDRQIERQTDRQKDRYRFYFKFKFRRYTEKKFGKNLRYFFRFVL